MELLIREMEFGNFYSRSNHAILAYNSAVPARPTCAADHRMNVTARTTFKTCGVDPFPEL